MAYDITRFECDCDPWPKVPEPRAKAHWHDWARYVRTHQSMRFVPTSGGKVALHLMTSPEAESPGKIVEQFTFDVGQAAALADQLQHAIREVGE